MQGTRRAFVKLAGASALAGERRTRQASWARNAKAQPLGDLPNFDGEVLFDEAARNVAGVDFGTGIRRAPAAVLRPRSVDDIVRIAVYANKTGRKIAMRGQGHSLYGRAQAEGGIVVDLSTLNAIRPRDDLARCPARGALGGRGEGCLQPNPHAAGHGRCADAVGGGTLSAGGIGKTSYREGCQVDHVSELEVVTATGDHVTCSPDRNAELFRMMLAGLGQCGIIVRARLRLLPAPRYVVLRTLNCPDLQTLVSEQGRLVLAEGLGPLTSRIVKEPAGHLSIDRRKLLRGWGRH